MRHIADGSPEENVCLRKRLLLASAAAPMQVQTFEFCSVFRNLPIRVQNDRRIRIHIESAHKHSLGRAVKSGAIRIFTNW